MKNRINFPITLVLLLLSSISLLVIFSVAPERLPQQATFLLVGFLLYLYMSSQDSALYKNTSWVAYGVSIVLLVSTLIFGQEVRGATRAISLFGTLFQPGEFAKPLLIISYAGFLTQWKPVNLANILKNMATAALPIILIFMQPDLGTAIVHSVIWIAMTIVAGLPVWAITLGGIVVASVASLSPRILREYQLERITSFLDPTKDPLGSGYNVIQSMIAIGSGEILGKGLGKGTQSQLRFLPERHTDFVFASFAEEFGFLGSAVLISLFLYLLGSILVWTSKARTNQGKLILVGVFSYLAFQTFLNLAMNVGIAPVTGITLPLVSSGGSSILATFFALGVVMSEVKDIKEKPAIEIA